ncbi:MAG TPA: tetratricopeptide repeat protein [Candidatus Paceibacterota bacterium]
MYCKNCGTKSDGIKKFCTKCGKEFSKSDNAKENTNSAQSAPSFSQTPSESSWSPGRIIGIIIVLAFIGWSVYSSQDDAVVEKNNNAITAFDSGNSDQAITQFQEASKDAVTNDNKINTLKNLAYVYSSKGQNDLAISTFKQALALTSGDSFDYYLIAGEIAILENKPNSAQISYNKAYEKNPNDFQINNALALFYLDIEGIAPQYADYKKAVQYALRATQLTDLQLAKQNLGLAYYFNENYPQAISTFSNLTLDKDSTTAYWLGLSYARNGDPTNAKFYLRKAIANGVDVPQEVYDYINSN